MVPEHSIRVMIVDDHAVVRNGLRFSLLAFPDLELVAEAENGRDALAVCEKLDRASALPHVILMDMLMPEMDGVAATQALVEHYPHVRILALTSFESGALVQDALRAGAIGYLLKDVSIDDLAGAVRAAHAGESTLAPAAAMALVSKSRQPQGLGDDLTDREREVLALVVEGLSNPQIARQLTVSLSTARNHVSTILSKLGAANRAEAAALAVKHDLVQNSGHSYGDSMVQMPDAQPGRSGYNRNGGPWACREFSMSMRG